LKEHSTHIIQKKNIFIVGSVWPEPQSSAAGWRMMQLINGFKNEGYEIFFASAANDSLNSIDFEKESIVKINIELNNSSFDKIVKEINPTIVMFDRYITEEQYGWRVTENCPDSLKILDTEDLHFLRKAREHAVKHSLELNFYTDVAKREIASILRCDVSLIISEYEIELLNNSFNISADLLHYLPFLENEIDNKIIELLPKYSERKNFISIGNFLHNPNKDSIEFLKNEIWPLIRKKLPDAELHVFGAYAMESIIAMNNKNEGFIIKSKADDADFEMQNARVCLAPLRFGAGLKGKLITAMQNGTPNVTTSIGAEGMIENNEWCGFLVNNATEIANAAIELYNNENTWCSAQKRGFAIINKKFNKEKYLPNFISKINYCLANLEETRRRNFLGAILNYQSMQSTKYMAKWIEEKNKKHIN
jgi:glycosyltransferase involved in cell wall biosynthesis